MLPALNVPSGLRCVVQSASVHSTEKARTYAILLNSLLLDGMLVSYVTALGTKLLCELGALGEGTIRVAVGVVLDVLEVERKGYLKDEPRRCCWSREGRGHP